VGLKSEVCCQRWGISNQRWGSGDPPGFPPNLTTLCRIWAAFEFRKLPCRPNCLILKLTRWSEDRLKIWTQCWLMSLARDCYNRPLFSDNMSVAVCVSASAVCLSAARLGVLGGSVVRALNSGSRGREFDSRRLRFRVTRSTQPSIPPG